MTETYKRYRIKVAAPIAALMLLIALIGWVTLDRSGQQYAQARFMVVGGALTLGVQCFRLTDELFDSFGFVEHQTSRVTLTVTDVGNWLLSPSVTLDNGVRIKVLRRQARDIESGDRIRVKMRRTYMDGELVLTTMYAVSYHQTVLDPGEADLLSLMSQVDDVHDTTETMAYTPASVSDFDW